MTELNFWISIGFALFVLFSLIAWKSLLNKIDDLKLSVFKDIDSSSATSTRFHNDNYTLLNKISDQIAAYSKSDEALKQIDKILDDTLGDNQKED